MSATVTATDGPAASHEYRIYGPLSAVTGAMFREYDHAKAKHGEQTPDGHCLSPNELKLLQSLTPAAGAARSALDGAANMKRLATLTEEVGEVGRCLTYDQDHAGLLRMELIQVAAMALAWASRLE